MKKIKCLNRYKIYTDVRTLKSFNPGNEYSVDETLADKMIKDGAAESVGEKPAVKVEPKKEPAKKTSKKVTKKSSKAKLEDKSAK